MKPLALPQLWVVFYMEFPGKYLTHVFLSRADAKRCALGIGGHMYRYVVQLPAPKKRKGGRK